MRCHRAALECWLVLCYTCIDHDTSRNSSYTRESISKLAHSSAGTIGCILGCSFWAAFCDLWHHCNWWSWPPCLPEWLHVTQSTKQLRVFWTWVLAGGRELEIGSFPPCMSSVFCLLMLNAQFQYIVYVFILFYSNGVMVWGHVPLVAAWSEFVLHDYCDTVSTTIASFLSPGMIVLPFVMTNFVVWNHEVRIPQPATVRRHS